MPSFPRRRALASLRGAAAALTWLWATLAGAQAPEAQKQITWMMLDWPPLTILRGETAPGSPAQLGAGVADRKLAELIARLPQYRHGFQLSSRPRVWEAMRDGQNVCDVLALKTPDREALAYFTPFMLVPPLSLVVRADLKQRITQGAGTVSLTALMKKSEFAGAIEVSRSYGPELGPLLTDAVGTLNRVSGPRNGFMVQLLAVGRYDYTLEYPMVVEYMRQQQMLSQALEVVPLKEAQSWAVSYVACTRNAWGKAVIQDIDAAIREAAAGRPYREALLPWLPAAYWARNRQRLNAFYDERAKSTLSLK
jgi:uncharacterized protein (TIGR02285 family)